MVVKKFLYHVRRDSKRYFILCERVDYLRASCLPSAIAPTVQVQVSPFNRTEEALTKLADLEKNITAQLARIRRHRAAAEALIGRLTNDNQRRALRLYFIELKYDGTLLRPLSFDEACGEMGLSPDSFKKHRKNGIAALQKMIENAPSHPTSAKK